MDIQSHLQKVLKQILGRQIAVVTYGNVTLIRNLEIVMTKYNREGYFGFLPASWVQMLLL